MTLGKEGRGIIHELYFLVLMEFSPSLSPLSTKGKEPRIMSWGCFFIPP